MMRRKIGILLAEEFEPDVQAKVGPLTDRFRAMLDSDFDLRFWPIFEGSFPQDPDECDAWIVSGSSAGVYDVHPWIATLRDFLQVQRGRSPLVGICFGHQMIAECFGGKAEKSDRGRASGFHDYLIEGLEPWMQPAHTQRVAVAHGDQVTQVPPGARVIASCEWTPYAALYYPALGALTVQCHPEICSDLRRALIEHGRGTRFSEEETNAKLAECERPTDMAAMHSWINTTLRGTR